MAQIKQLRRYSEGLFPEITSYSRNEMMNPIIETDLSFKDPTAPEFQEFEEQKGTGSIFKWFNRHKEAKDYDPKIIESEESKIEEEEEKELKIPSVEIQREPSKAPEIEVIPERGEVIDTAGKGILDGLLPSEILMYNLMKKR